VTRSGAAVGGLLLCGLCAGPLHAQSLTTEADVTVGRSTDDTSAGAVQVRAFGPLSEHWRVMVEAAWGRASDTGSDAFGSAYAYDNRVRPVETYAERFTSRPAGTLRLIGLKLGRYRTPFGMYSRSDQAYGGFSRAPLIRYGGNYALSNTFLETGASLLVGRPSVYVETSLGAPEDNGPDPRPRTADLATRVQAYYRSVIVGASYLSTSPTMTGDFVSGRMVFRGVDARWMKSGVQIRGEWIDGRPFDGVATRGGYVDVFVHHIGMGPVTAVGRLERVDYEAGPFSMYARRVTGGAHVRLTRTLGVQATVAHQVFRPTGGHRTMLDVSVTESLRF
jgi:hypothetical protein